MLVASSVDVVDFSDYLPLREVPCEDGLEIVAPPHEWAVVAYTPRGEIYVHLHDFGWSEEGKAKAEVLAVRVREVGQFNEDRWNFVRSMYGSVAYVEDGYQERDIQDERDGFL